jgi:hypothetical protein
MNLPPWEPPLASTELEHLVGAFERLRATFRWKAANLTADGLNFHLAGVSLTIGGLLKHLSLVGHQTFTFKVNGINANGPWVPPDESADPDWGFCRRPTTTRRRSTTATTTP